MELFLDCLSVGFMVIVVESNFHVAQEALLVAVNGRLSAIFMNPICDIKVNRNKKLCSYNRYTLASLCTLLSTLLSMSPLVKLLQFLMSLTHARRFLDQPVEVLGVALHILHESTPTCDENYLIPFVGVGVDAMIAFSASTVFAFLIMPVIYTVSKVVVPFG